MKNIFITSIVLLSLLYTEAASTEHEQRLSVLLNSTKFDSRELNETIHILKKAPDLFDTDTSIVEQRGLYLLAKYGAHRNTINVGKIYIKHIPEADRLTAFMHAELAAGLLLVENSKTIQADEIEQGIRKFMEFIREEKSALHNKLEPVVFPAKL